MSFEKWQTRNNGVITANEQTKLKKSTVLVCGLGGVGGICAEVLVRAGIGKMAMLDSDKYVITNLNRQIHAIKTNIKINKVDVFSKKAKQINPKLKLYKFLRKLTPSSFDFYKKRINVLQPDIVIDAFDNALARVLIYRICKEKKINYVYAACTNTRGMVSIFGKSNNMEKIFNLSSYGKKLSSIESELKNYPKEKPAWGAATNLVGVIAANQTLNYLLKKSITKAPEIILINPFDKQILRVEKLN